MIVVRRVKESDKAEWLRLRLALWPDDTVEESRQEMDEIFNDPNQPVFVAEAPESGLCGLLEVSIRTEAPGCTTDRIGYLEGWIVDEAFRQQGVGRALVKAAEDWALLMGCTEMASDTTPDYPISPEAHAALGYQETERHFRKSLAE